MIAREQSVGNVLVHFWWKCTYPVLVYVEEVHVRYYIWREAPRLVRRATHFLERECVARTVEIEVQSEEACFCAGAQRRRTLIVLFGTASK
jgi:hypothetical protein